MNSASCFIASIILLGISIYMGLALADVLPHPYPQFGGFGDGMMPTATAMLSAKLAETGKKKLLIERKKEKAPKPVEEFG